MPPSKKKWRPATRSQSKSLVETEAVKSGLALNFFFYIFFSEKRGPLIIYCHHHCRCFGLVAFFLSLVFGS